MTRKFCKDCKFFEQEYNGSKHYAWCKHPEAPRDMVFGYMLDCYKFRIPGSEFCGVSGSMWKEREGGDPK